MRSSLRVKNKEKFWSGALRNWVNEGAIVEDGKDEERNIFVERKLGVYSGEFS